MIELSTEQKERRMEAIYRMLIVDSANRRRFIDFKASLYIALLVAICSSFAGAFISVFLTTYPDPIWVPFLVSGIGIISILFVYIAYFLPQKLEEWEDEVEESLKEDYYPAIARLMGIPIDELQPTLEGLIRQLMEEDEKSEIAG